MIPYGNNMLRTNLIQPPEGRTMTGRWRDHETAHATGRIHAVTDLRTGKRLESNLFAAFVHWWIEEDVADDIRRDQHNVRRWHQALRGTRPDHKLRP